MNACIDHVARYRAALSPFDLAALRTVVSDMLAMEALTLPHPDQPEVITTCRSGEIHDLSNVLFFSDRCGEHRWCLVQSMDFIQAVITEAGVQSIAGKKEMHEIRRAATMFESGAYDLQFGRGDAFGGAMVSSSRPFHFFYDQLLHLEDLAGALPRGKQLAVGSCFFEPQGFGSWELTSVRDDRYYLLPNVAGAFQLQRQLVPANFDDYAVAMERRVAEEATAMPRTFAPSATVLWIGITGQKRSWLEQVEGYAAIINAVAEVSECVGVFIDGMTARVGERLSVPKDESVAAAIRRRLRPNVQVTSLIGQDYNTKIAHCRHVDAFVANGGTGCIVPLRFCRKPGVVHSNSKLRFFEGDSYKNVAFVEERFVVDAGRSPATAKTSYHIAWQHIHNLLAKVLRAEGRPAPDPLREPDAANASTAAASA